MAILGAYFDGSGASDRPAFVLGGYVATPAQWSAFEVDWAAALKDAGASHFRAAEFFHRKGAFSNWPDARHKRFARRFAGIAERHTWAGVARATSMAGFGEFVPMEPGLAQDTPNQKLTPRMLCARLCLEWIAVGWPDRPQGEDISVTFEDGPGVGGLIDYCFRLKRTQSWCSVYCTFAPGPKSFLPLQGADLMAYETYRHVLGKLEGSTRQPRKSFQRLKRRRNVSISICTPETLQAGIAVLKAETALQESNPTASSIDHT